MDPAHPQQQRRLRSSSSSSESSFSSASSSLSSSSEASMLTAYSPPLQSAIMNTTSTTSHLEQQQHQHHQHHNHNHHPQHESNKITKMCPPPLPHKIISPGAAMLGNSNSNTRRPVTRSRRASLTGGVFSPAAAAAAAASSINLSSSSSSSSSTNGGDTEMGEAPPNDDENDAPSNTNTLRSAKLKFSNNRTLRRSTGLLNLGEASLGSRATTKSDVNNLMLRQQQSAPSSRVPSPPFDLVPSSSSNTTDMQVLQYSTPNNRDLPLKRPLPSSSNESTPSKLVFPKPKALQQVLNDDFFDLKSDSPFRNMISNPKQAAKMRKMSSMDNLFLQHRKEEERNNHNRRRHQDDIEFHNPFASTSPSPSPTSAFKIKSLRQHALQPHGIAKPKFKLNPAVNAELAQEYSTPENYKSAKPLQTAFMSTGLLSKRNRSRMDIRAPPDTPCKKPVTPASPAPFTNHLLLTQHNNNNDQYPHINLNSPNSMHPLPFLGNGINNNTNTNSNRHSSLFKQANVDDSDSSTASNSGTPKSMKRSTAGLRDKRLRFSVDYSGSTTPGITPDGDTMMQDDEDMEPATPTKDKDQNQHELAKIIRSQPLPSRFSLPQAHQSWTDVKKNIHQQQQQQPPPHTPDLAMHEDTFAVPEPPSRRRSSVATTIQSLVEEPRTPAKTPSPFDVFEAAGGGGNANGMLAMQSKNAELDACLAQRFDDVSLVGRGEFSMVYAVSQRVSGQGEPNRFAVKRTKNPYLGPKARSRKLEEVEILRHLTQSQDEGREYVISLFDAWEDSGHLYIQTDYCENGSLDAFLSEHGSVGRLDEWRVWKIFCELSIGINFIHQEGFLHLDIKPANVFITFEGTLKIGDFGMATPYPAPRGIEREGDREYIAPELLSSEYGKPADIFSLGMMMLEIAANIVLPDNGIPWQKLRSGDLTEAGRLSSGDLRAAHHHQDDDNEFLDYDMYRTSPKAPPVEVNGYRVPPWAPKFLIDDSAPLDRLVQWMLNPDPSKRPTALDLLTTEQVAFVEARRKAGAVIYEGEFGPEPDGDDTDEHQDEVMQL